MCYFVGLKLSSVLYFTPFPSLFHFQVFKKIFQVFKKSFRCGPLSSDHFFSPQFAPAFLSQPPGQISPFFVALAGKNFSGADNLNGFRIIFSFRYNLLNFYTTPVKYHGVEFQGPFWAPTRLFPNIVNFSFVLIVPCLYGAIFRFRKQHTTTIQGWHQL